MLLLVVLKFYAVYDIAALSFAFARYDLDIFWVDAYPDVFF